MLSSNFLLISTNFLLLKAVVLSVAGFESMTPPFIVQEYRDHNECFYKVYVINDEVMVFRRPSLPNLDDLAVLAGNERNPHHTGESGGACGLESHYFGLKSVAFDSRYAYPTAADFRDDSYNSTEEQKVDTIEQVKTVSHNHSTTDDSNSFSNGNGNGSRNDAVHDRHNSCENSTPPNGHCPTTAIATADTKLKLYIEKLGATSSVKDACEHTNGHSAVTKTIEIENKIGEISDQRRGSTDSTGTVVSTVQAHSSPHACRESLNRVSVLSLEGRAKKPSAKDMPPLSAESSPISSSSSSGCNLQLQLQLQHQVLDTAVNGHSSGQYSSTAGVCHHINGNGSVNTPSSSTSTSISYPEHTVENNRSDCLMANARTVRTDQDSAKGSINTHSSGGPSSRRKSITINEGACHVFRLIVLLLLFGSENYNPEQ